MGEFMREENIKAIIAYLKPYFTPEFIAGLLGNVKVETANTFDPKTVQLGKGYTNDEYINGVYNQTVAFVTDRVGFGLFQLTTSRRKLLFFEFCNEHGYNIGDMKAQLEWFRYEITTTGYANVRKAVKEKWGIDEVARIICTEYERPESMQKDEATKERAIQNRIDCANLIYNEFLRKEVPKMEKKLKICLDAGHYGKYNRSPVVTQYYESDFTWAFTNYEKAELERLGFEVVLTRTDKNKDLDLTKRGKTFKGCVLGISNHSNACGTESVDHPSIIIPREEGEVIITDCTVLANRIGDNIYKTIGTKQKAKVYDKDAGYDRNKNGKSGDDEYYGVMDGAQRTDCPMYMIVEHGFHTNTSTAKWLLNDSNVKRLATSEANVIANFLKERYDLPTTGTETHTENKEDFTPPTDTYTYIVAKGDSLGKIAGAFHVSVDDIVALNNIANRNLIYVGQKLLIPLEGNKVKYYVVKKGDTLSGIAKRLGLNGYKELASKNNLSWPYTLKIGQTLIIP